MPQLCPPASAHHGSNRLLPCSSSCQLQFHLRVSDAMGLAATQSSARSLTTCLDVHRLVCWSPVVLPLYSSQPSFITYPILHLTLIFPDP